MRSRCQRCGHFIRNGKYCRTCIVEYKNWVRVIGEMYPNPKVDQLRKEYLTKMEAEMEHP